MTQTIVLIFFPDESWPWHQRRLSFSIVHVFSRFGTELRILPAFHLIKHTTRKVQTQYIRKQSKIEETAKNAEDNRQSTIVEPHSIITAAPENRQPSNDKVVYVENCENTRKDQK